MQINDYPSLDGEVFHSLSFREGWNDGLLHQKGVINKEVLETKLGLLHSRNIFFSYDYTAGIAAYLSRSVTSALQSNSGSDQSGKS